MATKLVRVDGEYIWTVGSDATQLLVYGRWQSKPFPNIPLANDVEINLVILDAKTVPFERRDFSTASTRPEKHQSSQLRRRNLFVVLLEELNDRDQFPQRGREVSLLHLQYFSEKLIVPSGALPLSFQAVCGGMVL